MLILEILKNQAISGEKMKFDPKKTEITFDDILLLPGKSDFLVDDEIKTVNTTGRVTQDLALDLPIISSPMPGISNADMAIALGKAGGMSVIHPFQSIAAQADQIKQVKNENVKVAGSISFNKHSSLKDVAVLLNAGADLISIETGHAYSSQTIDFINKVKNAFSKIRVSAALVVTGDATEALIKAGADNIRVGIGGGSHCTTRLVTGIGRPQLSAIEECHKVAKKYNIPIMSDTGIKYAGDLTKAFAFGAESIMIGGLLSGTDECPGEIIEKEGKKYKYSWGMCTDTAYKHKTPWEKINPRGLLKIFKNTLKTLIGTETYSNNNEKDFEEGVEALIPYRGSVKLVINQLKSGLIRSMWYLGAKNIKEIQKNTRVVLVSNSTPLENIPRI